MSQQTLPIAELQRIYPSLHQEDILDGLEMATIHTMEQLHRCPASAVAEEGLIHVTLFHPSGVKTFNLADLDSHNKLTRQAKRLLLNRIELELMTRQARSDARRFGSLRGTCHIGCIEKSILTALWWSEWSF